MTWKATPNAEVYLPLLNQAEIEWKIPTDLLARIAYQESHFRADIVCGHNRSRVGCVGLMQLNPVYFPHAGESWQADVITAGRLLTEDYARFSDWQLAIAAYNDGAGNVHQYVLGKRALPAETVTYVTQVVADVFVPGALIRGGSDG